MATDMQRGLTGFAPVPPAHHEVMLDLPPDPAKGVLASMIHSYSSAELGLPCHGHDPVLARAKPPRQAWRAAQASWQPVWQRSAPTSSGFIRVPPSCRRRVGIRVGTEIHADLGTLGSRDRYRLSLTLSSRSRAASSERRPGDPPRARKPTLSDPLAREVDRADTATTPQPMRRASASPCPNGRTSSHCGTLSPS